MYFLYAQVQCHWITVYFRLWLKSLKFKVLFPKFSTLSIIVSLDLQHCYYRLLDAYGCNGYDVIWMSHRETHMGDTNIFVLCPFFQPLHHDSHCLFIPSLDANANIIANFVLRIIPKDYNGLSNWESCGHAGKLWLITDCKLYHCIYLKSTYIPRYLFTGCY